MIQININYKYISVKIFISKVVIQNKLIYSIQIYNKILLVLNNISNIYLKQKKNITTYKS